MPDRRLDGMSDRMPGIYIYINTCTLMWGMERVRGIRHFNCEVGISGVEELHIRI